MIDSSGKLRYRIIFTLFSCLLIFSLKAFGTTQQDTVSHHQETGFNPGTLIVEHVTDSHEWHIMTLGETHVSIPLPVILYHSGKLDVFMSSKFHHGHESFKGFKLETSGENKGKVVVEETGEMPLDLSITKNVAAMLISMLLIIVIFISIGRSYTLRKGQAPKGIQSLIEPLIIFIRDDVVKASIGEKKYEKYLPYLLTLFFFIFFNNLLGLVPFFPGGANLTGNIAVTMVMALFTFVITTFSGNRNYWVHIINTPGVPWWLKIPVPLMPVVELMGVFTKPFVLMVRLFANITAGHIIVLGFMSLIFIFGNMSPGIGYGVSIVSVAFAVFMGLLELLVAFIQAYVFTLLSSLYFGMATEEHH
ncbi:MAG: F0F1 ATP synthase subunit A [Bacteroidetes bacterium]|nr:F0F1 ATP synthase subunit A [Bacteroidota bacterium]